MLDISPLASQKAPAVEIGTVAIVALLAATVAAVAGGVATFQRRDIVPG